MARLRSYNSSIQLVGLGGAGANIIEAFINHRGYLLPLLKKEGIRISCLAIDVADHDIQSLEASAKDLAEQLRDENIPADKISIVAKSVKFPTPESMFDFIGKYPEYLTSHGLTSLGKRRKGRLPIYEIWGLSGTEFQKEVIKQIDQYENQVSGILQRNIHDQVQLLLKRRLPA